MLSVFETKVVEGPKLSGQVMDITIIYCNSWFRLIFYNQRRFFVSEKWRIIKKRSSRNFGYSSSLAPETFFTCQTQLLRFLYLTSYSEYIFFSMNIINNVFFNSISLLNKENRTNKSSTSSFLVRVEKVCDVTETKNSQSIASMMMNKPTEIPHYY